MPIAHVRYRLTHYTDCDFDAEGRAQSSYVSGVTTHHKDLYCSKEGYDELEYRIREEEGGGSRIEILDVWYSKDRYQIAEEEEEERLRREERWAREERMRELEEERRYREWESVSHSDPEEDKIRERERQRRREEDARRKREEEARQKRLAEEAYRRRFEEERLANEALERERKAQKKRERKYNIIYYLGLVLSFLLFQYVLEWGLWSSIFAALFWPFVFGYFILRDVIIPLF